MVAEIVGKAETAVVKLVEEVEVVVVMASDDYW